MRREGARETALGSGAEDGALLTGVTNKGGSEVGARLTVAEGGTLRVESDREVTNECHDSDGGARKLPPET